MNNQIQTILETLSINLINFSKKDNQVIQDIVENIFINLEKILKIHHDIEYDITSPIKRKIDNKNFNNNLRNHIKFYSDNINNILIDPDFNKLYYKIKIEFKKWLESYNDLPIQCTYKLKSIGYDFYDEHKARNSKWFEHLKENSNQRFYVLQVKNINNIPQIIEQNKFFENMV